MSECIDPLPNRLVAARAAQRRGTGQREDARQGMAPSGAGARVVDVGEALGQGTHLGGTEHGLGNSFVKVGGEDCAGQLPVHVAHQGIDEHMLRSRCIVIAIPATAEPAGVSHPAPVRATIDRAHEARRVDERLEQHQPMAEPGGPVTHDAPRAQPQHPRPRIAPARPRQDQQPGVVRHQMKASILGAEVPPDPAVACPTLQRRGREHRQGEPRTVTMRDVAQRVPDLGQRPEIMVRLHPLLEPSFLLRADNIDDDFGQSHRSSSTLNGLVRVTSYHGNEGLTRPGGNILKVPGYSAGTDPPW